MMESPEPVLKTPNMSVERAKMFVNSIFFPLLKSELRSEYTDVPIGKTTLLEYLDAPTTILASIGDAEVTLEEFHGEVCQGLGSSVVKELTIEEAVNLRSVHMEVYASWGCGCLMFHEALGNCKVLNLIYPKPHETSSNHSPKMHNLDVENRSFTASSVVSSFTTEEPNLVCQRPACAYGGP
ncbi:hypothetical protein NE237_028283 [Protea cynaroides]|uniref:Uncharacterized protein n=1 Tax=Protea cynaroides TaxID=273540 RepID=A0A9Q0JTQ3_9MAGN|nr:hypothetical protein NE237_028283 [Protea cynaroides]